MTSPQKDSLRSLVVAAACCFGNFLAIGLSYSAGVYYVVFRDAFQVSPSSVSWISSINLGCTNMFGPVLSAVILKIGFRKTIIIGVISTSLGLILSSFATNVFWLYVTFGIIAGTGSGCVYQSVCTAVPVYFEKYRSAALGVVSAAAAVGQFVYPFIIPPLVNQYGWRGSMIILSGLILHICIAAMVVKPQSQPHTTQPKSELIEKDESKISEELMDKNTDNKEVETDEQEGMLKMSKELLCDLRFNIFSMLTFLYMAGSSVAYSYIAGYAKTMGIDEQRADLLVSIARGFSLGGRIILGMLGQLACVNILLFLAGAFALTGVGMVVAAISPTFTGCLICAAMFGFMYAASGPVYFEVMCRLFDTKRFTVALGYGMFIRGSALIVGAPLAGLVYEATSFFPSAFYFGGSLCIMSGLMGIALYCINLFHKDEVFKQEVP